MCLIKFISWCLTMWKYTEYGNIREYGKELENMERNVEKIWYLWR